MQTTKQTKSLKRLLTMVALVLMTAASNPIFSQNNIGINTTTPHASAALDVQSTTQGMLIPRMNATQRGLIATPATGLLVYQTDAPTGFYFYDGTTWTLLGATAQAYSGILPVANGGTGAASLTGLVLGNGTNAMTGLSGTHSGETINWNNTTGNWQITGTSSLALGKNAGLVTQGNTAVAIGSSAGYSAQGQSAVAMGYGAGSFMQGSNSIAIGNVAGTDAQGQSAVAIGYSAGDFGQGANSIAIGNAAGGMTQGPSAVAMGINAGYAAQGPSAVAMGNNAGYAAQGPSAVAMGNNAGNNAQGPSAVAMGDSAGYSAQGPSAVAMGNNAGSNNQGANSIAMGVGAGYSAQGPSAVAIGIYAGNTNQGANSIAIGNAAGTTSQAANSIILNASGAAINSGTSGLFIKPIRNASSPNGLLYDQITGEVTYSPKTFVIDHPTKSANYLVHACLEGPEAGVYYRGEAKIENNQSVTVTLPDYVSAFATNFSIQITPIYTEDSKGNLVYSTTRVVNNTFTVHGKNGSFYWIVYGQRGKVNVEPKKSETEVSGDGPYKYIKPKK